MRERERERERERDQPRGTRRVSVGLFLVNIGLFLPHLRFFAGVDVLRVERLSFPAVFGREEAGAEGDLVGFGV